MTLNAAAIPFLATSLLFSSCASDGFNKANDTAANTQAASGRMTSFGVNVDQTITCLNDLVLTPQADLRPQFAKFSKNVAAMEDTAKSLADDHRAMGDNAKKYLSQWDEKLAQIQNPELKEVSKKRRDDVSQQLSMVDKNYAQVSQSLNAFLADLQDTKTGLSVDLTSSGLDAVKGLANKSNQDAVQLKESLSQLAVNFKTLADSLSSKTKAAAN